MPTVRQKLGIEHRAILRLPISTHEGLFVPQTLNPSRGSAEYSWVAATRLNCDSQKFVS